MAQIDEVYSYLQENYSQNEPIFLSELIIPGIKPVSLRQQLKKLTDQYDDICKTYRDKKVEEIEISHQVWLADEAEKRLNRIQGNKK